VLPLVLAASITTETLLPVRHDDGVEPQPHTELEVQAPSLAVEFAPAVVNVSAATGGGGSATGFDIRQIS
jgi:hypothetical protein